MTGEVVFEHPLLILHGNTTTGQANFDAELDPDVRNARTNADLTLMLRVCLQRHTPPGGRGTMRDYDRNPVPVRSWTDLEWQNWTRRYVRECRRFWSGKFWLRTPDSYTRLDFASGGTTYRCNAYCRLDIQTTSITDGAHAVIPVVRLDGRHTFRSHALLYSHRDLEAERYPAARTNFFTHIHEVGHLLGLAHPGVGTEAGCVSGGEMVCYATDPDSVMGLGSTRRAEHAQPWQKAISLITGTRESDWRVSMRREYPRRV